MSYFAVARRLTAVPLTPMRTGNIAGTLETLAGCGGRIVIALRASITETACKTLATNTVTRLLGQIMKGS